ncbi:Aldo/keto reductase [Polyplosphaeria fusca]|uniref:Aldo/keto reductase n=1 Tax=Polyplosphaeria fusca TaxID=682080 RepID=A0A9P4QJV6_9PLEO|nr:Aldo/keto reductase [Polyplosphaeria fusca]
MTPPAFIFGGGSLTEAWREDNMPALLSALEHANIKRIDSAAIYPYTAPGGADRLLGHCKASEKGFALDTKVLFYGDGSGTMAPEAIQKSLADSLEGLGVRKINTYYLHAPDPHTPLASQAASMHAAYLANSFSHLGLCNISPATLQAWLSIADEHGYVKPTVYQGQYNLLCRGYETQLFTLLKEHGIAFVAFSPLAGGFLTGKVTFAENADTLRGTRFEVSETNFGGMRYRGFYDNPVMNEALRRAAPVCAEKGLGLGEAAMRWLLYHSGLDGERGDGVVIGPNSLEQLEGYVKAMDAGRLPEDLAEALDALWDEGVEEAAASIIEY